jgi:hypothetical protein
MTRVCCLSVLTLLSPTLAKIDYNKDCEEAIRYSLRAQPSLTTGVAVSQSIYIATITLHLAINSIIWLRVCRSRDLVKRWQDRSGNLFTMEEIKPWLWVEEQGRAGN